MNNEQVIELLEKAILLLRNPRAARVEPSIEDAEYLELAKRIEANAASPDARAYVRTILDFHAVKSYITEAQKKSILRTATMQKITHAIGPR